MCVYDLLWTFTESITHSPHDHEFSTAVSEGGLSGCLGERGSCGMIPGDKDG